MSGKSGKNSPRPSDSREIIRIPHDDPIRVWMEDGGSHGWTSIAGVNPFEKDLIAYMHAGIAEPIWELIAEGPIVLDVWHVAFHAKVYPAMDTGEPVERLRFVFLDADGLLTEHTWTMGLHDLGAIFHTYGLPPWEPAKPIEFRRQQRGSKVAGRMTVPRPEIKKGENHDQ